MSVGEHLNYSYDAGIAPTLLESYLQRRALENVEPNLGYLNDAEMIEQPKNNGKHVKFFRYTELPAITKPLYEGVTPDGQKLTETAFTVMTKPYGAHMEYTDELDLFHVDSKTQAMSDRLNRQAQLSIDTIGRDAICAGLNVMYPGAVTSRAALTSSNILTYAVIKKAVRNLKKKGAQPFADGFFHAKISHDTYYDLSGDSHWIAVAQYQNDTRVQRYELGTIYKVKFFEVDNPKIFKAETYLYGSKEYLTPTAYDNTTKTMTVSDTISEDEARDLTGRMVMVRLTTSATPTYAYTVMCVERVYPGEGAKIVFRWKVDSDTATAWASDLAGSATLRVVPSGGAANGDEVHGTIIYGQKAFGMVKLGGKGKPNIQIIVKPVGSSGSLDPLNQRGTIAWKVPHFACAVLQDDFIVRIEHGVSA